METNINSKVYKLTYKQKFGASLNQIKYMLSFSNFDDGGAANNRLMNYLSSKQASEIIDLLKKGEKISIKY